MSDLGTDARALRVAIVGSGPSGFYATESLYKSGKNVEVSLFDRLPTPFGLVRYGVAPDHAKIKNVTKVYEKTAEHKGFSFFGNVEIGKNVSIDDLKKYFDAIIFTYGAETDRNLGIPGEHLRGSHTATEFVAWYNGHPDYKNRHFDLTKEVAVIVGQGNVACDVCRILCKTVDELKNTDIAQHAIDALSQSKIKEVHMIGRRGPAQAAFTPVEIREFGELNDCAPVVLKEDLALNESSKQELELKELAQKKKNYDIMTELVNHSSEGKGKKFFLHFLKSPVELAGQGQVEKIILEKNELSGEPGNQKSRGTGVREELDCGLFFRSVGYRGIALKGLPFHDKWGIVPNEEGRIMDSEHHYLGLYTAGWIKRGPSGIIGTNKPDSEETVSKLIEDIDKLVPCKEPSSEAFLNFLKEKNIRYISFDDWKKIDAAEISNGEKKGKPREKFTSITDMLQVIN